MPDKVEPLTAHEMARLRKLLEDLLDAIPCDGSGWYEKLERRAFRWANRLGGDWTL